MRLLLDTHAFLWWLADNPNLLEDARDAIADPSSDVFVSAVSVWELAIKAKLGKLDLAGADPVEEIAASDFIELPITARHAAVAGSLPLHHTDPFDRMLIAQAQIENLVIVTRDPAFDAYEVSVIPA